MEPQIHTDHHRYGQISGQIPAKTSGPICVDLWLMLIMSELASQTSLDTSRRLDAARAGDQAEFGNLVEPHRNELLTHCYRLVGSLQDAEDLVQETFLRAWRRLETFQERASFRAWLYKIATNACLDALDRNQRRVLPVAFGPASDPDEPMLPPMIEPVWLEPFPDERIAPVEVSAEARYDAKEAITLAFMVALQTLPPRQRAVIILRDVLAWRAKEVAGLLEVTVSSVNSMLYRARATLAEHYPAHARRPVVSSQADETTRELLEQYVRAWESADVDALISLLKEDATFPMPPLPSWYQGRASIRRFISLNILDGDARGRWRLLPVRANVQPAYAWYRRDEFNKAYNAFAIQVLAVEDNLLVDITTIGIPALFPYFGMPMALQA
jgi:RNA polymerase sigma-70 factor (ECF subfamily)